MVAQAQTPAQGLIQNQRAISRHLMKRAKRNGQERRKEKNTMTL